MKVIVQHAVGDPDWQPAVVAPDAVAEFARLAEQGGYAAIGFTDHPAPTTRWTRAGGEGSADPFVSLAFCAAVTRSIRLLTFVLVLPYRNPFLMAHQAATLDVMSGGRLTLGLGTGYLRGEMHALGVDPARRREEFDHALDTAIAAWTGEEVTAQGTGWSARGVHVQPEPVQRPHPPLWFHGNSLFGRERAARVGQGWLGILNDERLAATMRTSALPDFSALERAVEDLRVRTERHGRQASEVAVAVGGAWPMLDIRRGWDAEKMLDEAEELRTLGADALVVTVCGDDAGVTNETLVAFAEQIVRPLSR